MSRVRGERRRVKRWLPTAALAPELRAMELREIAEISESDALDELKIVSLELIPPKA